MDTLLLNPIVLTPIKERGKKLIFHNGFKDKRNLKTHDIRDLKFFLMSNPKTMI